MCALQLQFEIQDKRVAFADNGTLLPGGRGPYNVTVVLKVMRSAARSAARAACMLDVACAGCAAGPLGLRATATERCLAWRNVASLI